VDLQDGKRATRQHLAKGHFHLPGTAAVHRHPLAPAGGHIDPLHRAEVIVLRAGTTMVYQIELEMPWFADVPGQTGHGDLGTDPVPLGAPPSLRQTRLSLAQVLEQSANAGDADLLQFRHQHFVHLQLSETGQVCRRLGQRGLQPFGTDPVQSIGHDAHRSLHLPIIHHTALPHSPLSDRPFLVQQMTQILALQPSDCCRLIQQMPSFLAVGLLIAPMQHPQILVSFIYRHLLFAAHGPSV